MDKISHVAGKAVTTSTAESMRKNAIDSQREGAEKAEPAASSSNDKVTVTDSAQSMLRLEQAVAASGDIDTEKVESIRQSIENGDYQINAKGIADAIVNDDTEMLGLL